jgi:hypothetical protein
LVHHQRHGNILLMNINRRTMLRTLFLAPVAAFVAPMMGKGEPVEATSSPNQLEPVQTILVTQWQQTQVGQNVPQINPDWLALDKIKPTYTWVWANGQTMDVWDRSQKPETNI